MAGKFDTPQTDAEQTDPKARKVTASAARADDGKTDTAKTDADKQADETAKNNPMLADDRTVDADGALQFATDVRALVDEVSERLDEEVNKHITDMAGVVNDATSGPLLAATRRLQVAVEAAQRELRIVAATAAQMGQDVVA